MPVVTFLNQKGGVGKTSSCFHLAGSIAASGRRVLLVDNDPQSSLTQGILGPQATEELPTAETIHEIYRGGNPLPESVIRATPWKSIDLVAGHASTSRYNKPDPTAQGYAVQTRLADFMNEVKDRYDVILIDCPPNLHACSWAALLATDGVVIPLQAEDYGAQGITAVRKAIAEAIPFNPSLVLLGFVITMFDARTAIARVYRDLLRERYPDLVLEQVIPRSVDFSEAVNQRLPLSRYRPRGKASAAVDLVRDELLETIDQLFDPTSHAGGHR